MLLTDNRGEHHRFNADGVFASCQLVLFRLVEGRSRRLIARCSVVVFGLEDVDSLEQAEVLAQRVVGLGGRHYGCVRTVFSQLSSLPS